MDEVWNDDIIIEGKMIFSFSSSSFSFFFLYFEGRSAVSFAKEVDLLHGGDLTVQSELNKGSRFTLHLPIQTS